MQRKATAVTPSGSRGYIIAAVVRPKHELYKLGKVEVPQRRESPVPLHRQHYAVERKYNTGPPPFSYVALPYLTVRDSGTWVGGGLARSRR